MMTIIRLVQSTARICQRRRGVDRRGRRDMHGGLQSETVRSIATASCRNVSASRKQIRACHAVTRPMAADSTTIGEAMARPRSEEARQAALDATVDLLLASGVEGVTFDEVAARSGVAKTTLYRHFGIEAGHGRRGRLVLLRRAPHARHRRPASRTSATIFDRWQDKEKAPGSPTSCPCCSPAATAIPSSTRLVLAMLDERRRPIRTVLQLAQLRRRDRPRPRPRHGASPCSSAPSSSGGWSTARRSPTSSATRCSSRSWRACAPPAMALSNWHER